tara:strand:+ start:1016 stop:2326 length:1311 start_codon:yes stop_codon:yes gene_type:complete
LQKILISKIVKIIIEKNPRFVFDSRNIKKGDIFIGIKTKNDDGSNYIDSALQKGCLLAIINSKHSNKKVIYTMNVTKFIKLIAYEVLNKYKGKVIAITGSVGKTTMKENISNYLFSKNITHFKSYKNFNNELGLIFNILNIKFNSTYSIFELGISKINEMKKLTNILNPHYVLITNIENSHIGNFESYKSLMLNKLYLLNSNRLIFGLINFRKNINLIPNKYKSNKKISFINLEKDVDNLKIKTLKNFSNISFNFSTNKYFIKSESDNIINIKIALFTFLAMKNIVSTSLKDNFFHIKSLLPGHGYIIKNNKKYTIYDHSYNASPYSLRENLMSFLNMPLYNKYDIIIIGSMKELGKVSSLYHKQIIEIVKNNNNIFLIGDEFYKLVNKYESKNLIFFRNYYESLPHIIKRLNKCKNIFIMGSHGNKLDMVVKELC